MKTITNSNTVNNIINGQGQYGTLCSNSCPIHITHYTAQVRNI